jgi:probable rRNA maturation factor
MSSDATEARVTVTNRQRRRKVNIRLLAGIAEQALDLLGDEKLHLGIVLVGDVVIAGLNAKYHETPAATDVLSFDYGAGQGELVISVERAIAQARRFRTTSARELALYVVHGILHLHGYNDLTAAERRRMRAAERRTMSKLLNLFELKGLIS